MERVEHTESTIEVFENDIDFYLQEFAERDDIKDFKSVTQSVWNSALRYVYDHVFKPNPSILKSHTNISITGNDIPSNYNAYNYNLLNDICDYYIYNMCMRYNKEVSVLIVLRLCAEKQRQRIFENSLSLLIFDIFCNIFYFAVECGT